MAEEEIGESALARIIGPLQDPVTWYGINYTGTQMTQRDLQTKESRAGLVRVPLFWESHCVICVPV